MTELFEIYQENIKSVFTKLTKLLESIPIYSTDKAEIALQEAEAHSKEAERIIKNMEIQSIQLTSSKSSEYSLVLKNYKSGIDSYKKRIIKAKESIRDNKKLDSFVLTTDTSAQKEKLINNEEIIWKSFDKLENAKRATIEMENVSMEIGRELNNQTDKMKGVGQKLNEINNEINISSGLISRMMRMQTRNKIILAFFSIMLIFVFLIILYFKFVGFGVDKNNNNNNNNSSENGNAANINTNNTSKYTILP